MSKELVYAREHVGRPVRGTFTGRTVSASSGAASICPQLLLSECRSGIVVAVINDAFGQVEG